MISALGITYNEIDNIERYIKSLSFADEIIIVDSFSTDGTTEKAEQLGASVIKRKFTNFSDQKNYAISLAKNDWIVFFDLDEEIPESLIEEIKTVTSSVNALPAYQVKRQFHFMGKSIKYSGFQSDVAIRVFKKSKCRYNKKLVHENIICDGKIGHLKNKLNHQTYRSFDNYNAKLTHYSQLQAQTLYNKNVRPNMIHFMFRPLYRFLHQYFIRLGFLDGKEGFIISYVHAFSVFKRYINLWAMHRQLN